MALPRWTLAGMGQGYLFGRPMRLHAPEALGGSAPRRAGETARPPARAPQDHGGGPAFEGLAASAMSG